MYFSDTRCFERKVQNWTRISFEISSSENLKQGYYKIMKFEVKSKAICTSKNSMQFLLLFSDSYPNFFPIALPYPIPPRFQSESTPLSTPMCSLFVFLCLPLPLCSPLSPSSLVTVSLFFVSKSLVLFCSLVCFVD